MSLALAAEAAVSVAWQEDDGTEVVVQVSPEWAERITRMNEADRKREERHRVRQVAASQVGRDGLNLDRVIGRDSGILLLGLSQIWSGPSSLWLAPNGMPCVGQLARLAPIADHDGRLRARKDGVIRCRLCGHYGRSLPHNAVCLNADCSRTGRDRRLRKPPARVLRATPKDDGLKGGCGDRPQQARE